MDSFFSAPYSFPNHTMFAASSSSPKEGETPTLAWVFPTMGSMSLRVHGHGVYRSVFMAGQAGSTLRVCSPPQGDWGD